MSAKILIIDDEASIRMMMRLTLEHSGYEVTVAEDGPSGITAFGDGSNFDVVVLDQRMPGMHGAEVQHELKKLNSNVRIIMTTAFGTADLAKRVLDSGASDFIRKPFTADTLRLAVKAALGQPIVDPTKAANCFSRKTINGFQMELLTEIHDRHFGELICTYRVSQPEGEPKNVKVVLPQYVMELVKAHADTENVPCQNRFWQAMSEEALANYLWQEATLPPDNILKITELTKGLERWVDGVMTVEADGVNA